jgi:peptidyl-prolyl cis-trans isomerase SurA
MGLPSFSAAQVQQNATEVAAVVNGAVISNYDVDQRLALLLATTGVQATEKNLPQIRAQVTRALEDETIELQEAKRHNISATKEEVDKAVQNIAADNKLKADQLLAAVGRAGVTTATFVQQIAAQIIWQKLVAARYSADVAVTDDELDAAMKRLRGGADKPQFLLSEIYVGVDRPEDETATRDSVAQLARQIMMGASFQTIASQFSPSPSAVSGGDIGWVVEGQMDEAIDEALLPLKPGQITAPIRAEGGYYLLLLRDRREPSNGAVQPASVPAQNPDAAVPLDRLLLVLPADPDAQVKDRAMSLARNVVNAAKSCSDLMDIGTHLMGATYTHLGEMRPDMLDSALRTALQKTGPGDVVPPFFSAAGLEVIMRCDAQSAGGDPALPTREQLRQQLFTQQMSLYAKSYLQELRRDAVIYATGG